MKLNINATLESPEMIKYFLEELQKNNITPKSESIKLEAYSSKKSEWVVVENLRLVYNQE